MHLNTQATLKPPPRWGRIVLALICLFVLIIMIGQAVRLSRWQTEGEFGFADAAVEELSRLRSALQAYKAANGMYPKTLGALKKPPTMVQLHTSRERHDYTADVTDYMGNGVCAGEGLKDTGGWGYVADPTSSCHGRIFLDCSHLRKGQENAWWTY